MHIKRRRNLLRRSKGFRWGRKSKIKLAKTAVKKAGAYAYRDRRVKKREARKLWQVKINAATRASGMPYNKFMHLLKEKNIVLDRKILSQIAEKWPSVFEKIVAHVKK